MFARDEAGLIMLDFPPEVRHEIDGWHLFWAALELGSFDPEKLSELRAAVTARVRASYTLDGLAQHPTVVAVRKLFRQTGCDPTRYRPASEALLRRLLKGEELPAIHPFVDLNNCLSAELAVPVCVMDRSRLSPPFIWRVGRPGEVMVSLKGPFNVEAKPVLADQNGAIDVPITGSDHVRVTEHTQYAWLVAYLPHGVVSGSCAEEATKSLINAASCVRLNGIAW